MARGSPTHGIGRVHHVTPLQAPWPSSLSPTLPLPQPSQKARVGGARLTFGLSYGTTFAALSALAPRRCILDIDLQGVLQLRRKASAQSPPLEPVYLFLSPPSVHELKSRLRGRGTETPESLQKRLGAAKKELQYAQQEGHDVVIVNRDLKEAGDKLERVAMGWEGWEGAGNALPKFELGELDEA